MNRDVHVAARLEEARMVVSLLNSMVEGGEAHSEISREMVACVLTPTPPEEVPDEHDSDPEPEAIANMIDPRPEEGVT